MLFPAPHSYHHQNSRYKIYYNCHIEKHPEAVICFHYCTYSSLKCRIVNYVLIKRYYVECLGIIFATSLIQMFLMNNPQGKMISSASLISSTDFLLFIFAFLSRIYKQERGLYQKGLNSPHSLTILQTFF